MHRSPVFASAFVLAVATLQASDVTAQSFPVRPIRLVVPYPPGGGSDLAARIIGNELTNGLGQSVIIDNRSGAQGGVGTALVARATPDGYTLLLFVGALVVNPWVYKNVDFDPVKDFSYVSLVTSQPSVAAIAPKFGPSTLKELATFAAAKPGQVRFGHGNISGQLTGELFMQLTGTKMLGVPYKGAGPAILDVAGNRIDLVFASPPSSIPMIRAGRVKGLAVIGPTRLPAIPDVPTSKESGFPEFMVDAWYAIAAPARTPRAVIDRLNAEIRRALQVPAVKDGLAHDGLDARSNSPEEMNRYAQEEFVRWGKVAKAAGIKPE